MSKKTNKLTELQRETAKSFGIETSENTTEFELLRILRKVKYEWQ